VERSVKNSWSGAELEWSAPLHPAQKSATLYSYFFYVTFNFYDSATFDNDQSSQLVVYLFIIFFLLLKNQKEICF